MGHGEYATRAFMNRLARYVLAALGPVATAGVQFLLSLLLLRSLPPAAFGGFSFLLIAATLATSVWSAMFCAPLLVFMTQRREQGADQAAKAVLMASVVGAAIATVGFAALALATGFPAEASVIFAFFASLGLVRWLGRAHAYALGHQTRTIASDVVYAVSLMGGIGLLFTLEAITLDHAYLVLLVATVAGIGALGRPYASALLIAPTPAVLRGYRRVWREHSSWSLAGVVSTEATVNCHAYLVTAICGPAAFAPIAATQLLIRPITVATNALMEFERAQMARQLGEGAVDFGRARLAAVPDGAGGCVPAGGAGGAGAVPVRPAPAVSGALCHARAGDGGRIVVDGGFHPRHPHARKRAVAGCRRISASGDGQHLFRRVFHRHGGDGSGVRAADLVGGGRTGRRTGVPVLGMAQGVAMDRFGAAARSRRQGRRSGWRLGALGTVEMEQGQDRPLLTIGIKALNEEEHIAAAIASALAAVARVGGDVVLADSGSTDRTLEIARTFPIRIVQLANLDERCCGAGAQLAFQHATGEFFYLLDGDMELDPAFIDAGIAFLRDHPGHAGVGGGCAK